MNAGPYADPASGAITRMNTLIIIPAYNEAANIRNVIRDIGRQFREADIVVIDDGSRDETGKLARAEGVAVLTLPFNLGIGAAMQTGYRYAGMRGYEAAIQFDGDGQHRADQIGTLLGPLLSGEADIVIGSRFIEKGVYDAEIPRFLGIQILSKVISLLVRQRITDPTSGFRAVNRRIIEYYSSAYPDDYPEPEAIVLLSRLGFRIREVPVRMEKRTLGSSSITLIRGLYYMIKVLLAIFVDMLKKVK